MGSATPANRIGQVYCPQLSGSHRRGDLRDTRQGASLAVKSTFESSDRGEKAALTATLRLRLDLTPEAFEIKGKSPGGYSTRDASVVVRGSAALIHEDGATRQARVERCFFTLRGYAPVTTQMMLVRYWGRIQTLPGGEAVIEQRGRDVMEVSGKRLFLDRYSLDGIIWGRETLWFDSGKELIAAMTVDPLWGQFEVIRQGYEAALPLFASLVTKDRLAALAQLAERIRPAQSSTLAITDGLLIDGTGRPPVPNAVVVIEGDHIVAAGPRSEINIAAAATVVDAGGKTLLAGLWDMHAHYSQVEWGPVYLAAGVTTVRDCQNEVEFITAVRDAIQSGHGLGPGILLAGLIDGQDPRASGIDRAGCLKYLPPFAASADAARARRS